MILATYDLMNVLNKHQDKRSAMACASSEYICRTILRQLSILNEVAFSSSDGGWSFLYGVKVIEFVEDVLFGREQLPSAYTMPDFIAFVHTIPYCRVDPTIQGRIYELNQVAMGLSYHMMTF